MARLAFSSAACRRTPYQCNPYVNGRRGGADGRDAGRSAAKPSRADSVSSFAQRRHVCIRAPGHGGGDAAPDQIGRLFQRVAGQMRVSLRCCRLGVPEQRANDRQAQATSGANARETVPQIMDSNVGKSGLRPDAVPRLPQVDQWLAWQGASNNPGRAVLMLNAAGRSR